MFESLQYRDFRWMWAGSFVSFTAMMMQMITRGWLVLRLADDSPLALAFVMMSFAVPSTFVSLIGGALADRVPKKRLIIWGQSGNAAMTLLLAVLDATDLIEFWHVLVIGFANGSMMSLAMPGRQAILSEIVPERSLMNAISLTNSGMNMTRIIGPALAGFLIVFIGTSGVFFLVSAVYMFAAGTMAMVNAGSTSPDAPRKSVAGDIKAGFAYVVSDRTMLGVIVLSLLTILFGSSYWALMPAWAREALDVQSDGLGILMTIMGAGALMGTLGLAAIQEMPRRGLVLLAMALTWGLSLSAFSQMTSYLVAVPFLLILGLVNSVFMSLNMTMMQVLAPPEMRGRMMAIGMMTFGAMPLSALPFGFLAETTGSTPDALFVSGMLLTVATLIFWLAYPTLRRLN
ncbi:MAG: MFS transporter [SAR202 cluster bacterium]|jgi:MFS family permease|nr:hypothetical protein [Chloroflexota bacterium]MDP6422310.1 MFS transporter [SAR202 cluster bacterium]HAL46625.1 hypothetical protein [Dehalococcoidia bacterium]MDP6664912.1 MFS transporter [SAR202 cluster bacterium]MDP6801241.1 MFS transporter [SAR202 cluster bacterium]|tara:strand:- start:5756 stop:6958 length:1203 start_codon:yes stop_codon:yes gene_type:complete